MAAAVIFLICVFALTAAADDIRVIDYNSTFSDTDFNRITEACLSAEAETGVKFFVVTRTDKPSDSEMPGICGLNRSDDFCVLLIQKNRVYTLYTYGTAEKRISSDEVNAILDDNTVYSSIKNGSCVDGALKYISMSADAVKVPWGIITVVAVIAGAVACGIACSIVIGKYKMKMRPTNYPLDKFARLDLKNQEDTFLTKHVAVFVSSSGGGGGARGGSGGHVSGGGARGSR